jgi:hypothetical protein
MHLQHVGSDRTLWRGNPLTLVSRLQDAASESEAMDRARDLHFALDQLLADPVAQRVDASRIAAAGHSYGANTTLLVAGARVTRDGKRSWISATPAYVLRSSCLPRRFMARPIRRAFCRTCTFPPAHHGPRRRHSHSWLLLGRGRPRAVFAATGSADKTLVVFKAGSHSMFTDRLGTGGGAQWNPQVKAATRELALDFLRSVFDDQPGGFEPSASRHQVLLQRFEHRY